MAFDGVVIASLVSELNHTIANARISKIAQPEKDALLLTLKGSCGQKRLFLSASASLPLIYLTEKNKPSPLTAPNFCMLLRKHISNGRIVRIWQPDMERIIHFEIEHLDDLGDVRQKTLTIELMGKHSNLIFTDENKMIIDSIKHVPAQVSSVREVLPGRDYFIPSQGKHNPLMAELSEFLEKALAKPVSAAKAIYTSYTGISPCTANEICYRAGIDADAPAASLNEEEKLHLGNHFIWMMQDIREEKFTPNIVLENRRPLEFSSVRLTQYGHLECEEEDSVSAVLEHFYAARDTYTRIRQKSVDLRKIVSTALERNHKKYQLQLKQLQDTEKRDKYKVYGELINTYGYSLEEGAKTLEALNYYTNEMIKIPLDTQLSPKENAKKYFEKYSKLKRTNEALSELIVETKAEIEHLESIATSLDIALNEDDLVQIKEELTEYGYIRRRGHEKKQKVKSRPFHYRSSDGFDIYIGKNNYQNEEITFKLANGGDWWFHAKKIPGSHVIVKTNGEELPDRTFEEAAMLAGYYSQGREAEKIEIDYLQRKNVKKPNGSAPGFVVYYTNYSMAIHPDISGIELVSD
ncbi:MAG: fibronectin/fibrinogen-binding protein [Eubacterium sp.]|nr:fibronectin/fibrinogen-binding protein [Eubacterium sp.]MCI8919706.1 fibronectin/fibrinogen-binding protein [Eubacterium sp.]